MPNIDQLTILKKGVDEWNNWRMQNKNIEIDLSNSNLSGLDLKSINLNKANLKKSDLSQTILSHANFFEANLEGVNLTKSILYKARLMDVNLMNSNLEEAKLMEVNLRGAKLSNSILYCVNLRGANMLNIELRNSDLSSADLTDSFLNGSNLENVLLRNATMIRADLSGADLTHADLSGTNLAGARCIETNFESCNIENACVYGISIWSIKTNGLKQNNLIITREGESVITVDNLEVAQFIYLMLNNEKIRDVIGTIAKKGVLILGRFSPERKKILEAIREKLRHHDFVPMMFDFEKISSRDLTETIKILAGLSKFIIADISEPSSIPLELQATVPDYGIPFLPIIQKGLRPFAMFTDLQLKYQSVSDLLYYENEPELISTFEKSIIERANQLSDKLIDQKALPLKTLNAKDFL